jgi:hypothetical protein
MVKGGKFMAPSFELEGETNRKYYFIMRFIFFCYVIVIIYLTYESALLDYPGSKLFYYSLLIILFIILILIFFLFNYSILIHSLKRRKIVIDDNNIQYFIGNRLKKEISFENIIEIKIQRYSLSRLAPWMLTFTKTYSEKNILISYKEKLRTRNLRLYYVDFLPANSLDRLFEQLKNVSSFFGFEIKDKSESLLSILHN